MLDQNDMGIIKERIIKRQEAADVLMGLPYFGLWVKNLSFEFLDISENASKTLYGLSSSDVIGKNDYEIADMMDCDLGKALFAEVCRASDLYVLDHPIKGKYPIYQFIEFLTDTDGNSHIWKTTKGVDPEQEGKGEYFWASALFLDKMLGGYKKALNWFENKDYYEKVNDNLYVCGV